MKKIVLILLVIVSLFTLTSCDRNNCIMCEGRGYTMCTCTKTHYYGRIICGICQGRGSIEGLDCVFCGAFEF